MPEKSYFRFYADGDDFSAEIEVANMNRIEITACICGMLENLINKGTLKDMDLSIIVRAVRDQVKLRKQEKESKKDGD